MKSVFEAQAFVLNTAIQQFEATLDKFARAIHEAALKAPQTERYRRLAQMGLVLETIRHFPAMLIMQSRGQGEWMLEEFEARITPDFIEAVNECHLIYSQSWTNPDMAPLGIIWWISQEIIEKHGRQHTNALGEIPGKPVGDDPDDYLLWLWDNNKCSGPVKQYIQDNLDAIKANIKNGKVGKLA